MMVQKAPEFESDSKTRIQGGFTLVEMVVTVLVMAILITGMLVLFDTMSKISRVQTHLADLQQNLRVAQYEIVRLTRMTGRGGLLRGQVPAGLALNVRNNIPDSGDDAYIAFADNTSPKIMPESDVLTVRGVFSSPVYQMNSAGGYFTRTEGIDPQSGSTTVVSGTMRVLDPNPDTGVPQDLSPLVDAINDGLPVPILLVSPLEDLYAVVQLNAGGSTITSANDVTLAFTTIADPHGREYGALTPRGEFPFEMETVAAVGLLEERRYYVAEPDDVTIFEPRITLAEFYAGTETPFADDASNLSQAIADNILDFQVALGIDSNDDGAIDDATEWLFDDAGDVQSDGSLTLPDWNTVLPNGGFPDLFFVRISTLARTDRADFNYLDDPITGIEDHAYGELAAPADDAERLDRRHRRRVLETVVDLRNL